MRKVSVFLAAMLATASGVMAQGPYSLQVGEVAAPASPGSAATAGVNFGPDTMYFGARGAVGLLKSLLFFGDVGWVEVDGRSGGPSFQGGGLVTLPLPLPVDVGIRGTIYKPFIEDYDIWGGALGGVVSRDLETAVPGLSVYGYMGLDFETATVEVPSFRGSTDVTDDTVDLALAVGAVFRFADKMSVYGELSYVDDPFIGGGLRVSF